MRGCIVTLVVLAALATSAPSPCQEVPRSVRLPPPSLGSRRDTPATITYVVDTPAVKAVTIEIVDERGRIARRFSSSPEEAAILGGEPLSTSPGEHAITWDLRHACGAALAGVEILSDIRDMEPWVVPGTFLVRLAADRDLVTRSLGVTLDRGITASPADLEAQLKLSLEMCDRRRTALSSISRAPSHFLLALRPVFRYIFV
jgi:hypothetical protein